ncbi:sigma factor-like helix-turn-helix DNA-binding protein [Streptomyces sp. NPDC051322]|uniref:sigma factor-like helix-turn-helix DNA-binding protein n=1 Tax=Streptomyces sp. NPDC051322 TaxID=3154645 RepID=UPI00344BB2FC
MRERTAVRNRRRAQEFESFVAGAAGRLLHAATLLTAEPLEPAGCNPRAQRLLLAALSHTYAHWDQRRGDDLYDRTRQELASRFAAAAWRYHRAAALPAVRRARRAGRPEHRGGVLERLTPQERLILVLRLYEGVEEEQAAALLGLPAERVHSICMRAVATMRSAPPAVSPAPLTEVATR